MTDIHLIKLVWYVVSQYTKRLNSMGIDEDEAFSRGLVGLAYAVKKYDSTQGKFGSFAFQCIKREIFSFPTRDDYWNHFYKKIFTLRDLFYQRTGRRLENFELAKLIGVKEEFINRGSCRSVSLERCHFDEGSEGVALYKEPADNKEPPPWQGSLEDDDNKFVVETVQDILNDCSILDDDERKVIKLLFGLPPLKSKYQMKQLPIILGVCLNEVRRIRNRALEKLSCNERLQKLFVEA